jgi:hypothetical protein
MISTVNHYSAYAYFNFSARNRYAYARRRPHGRGTESYFCAAPLLGWRSDGVYLGLRARAGRGLRALHFCWRTLRNHGRLALVGFGSDQLSRAWWASFRVSAQSRCLVRDAYPRLKPAPWWHGGYGLGLRPRTTPYHTAVKPGVNQAGVNQAQQGSGRNYALGVGLTRTLRGMLRGRRGQGLRLRPKKGTTRTTAYAASLQARLTHACGRALAQLTNPRSSGGLSNPDPGFRPRVTVRPARPEIHATGTVGPGSLGPVAAPDSAINLSLCGPRSDFGGTRGQGSDERNRTKSRSDTGTWAIPLVRPEIQGPQHLGMPRVLQGTTARGRTKDHALKRVHPGYAACARADRHNWARNPTLSQVDLIVFADASRTPGLVKQARQLRIPSLSLDAGLRRGQDTRRCAGNPGSSFELLGNPENGWLATNLSLTLLNLSRHVARRDAVATGTRDDEPAPRRS